MEAKRVGFIGEELAAKYLTGKGYEILQNNFTIRGGEIDLIAQNGGILVFVEVKTRSCSSFGYADESLDVSKRGRLHRAIKRYLANEKDEPDYRVDLVEVELDSKTRDLKQINHLEDIEL